MKAKANAQPLRSVMMTLLFVAALCVPLSVSAQPRVDGGSAPAGSGVITPAASAGVLDDELKYTLNLPMVMRAPSAMQVARIAAVSAFQQDYLGTAGVAPQWTGDHASCTPGTTAANFQSALLRRINYYRALAGVPAQVKWNSDLNQKAQAAALVMSANDSLSHAPSADWDCYSSGAKEAAGRSDLSLGALGSQAIDMYMQDPGNDFLGHRRWILYPQTQEMGTGDVSNAAGHPSSNALWVIDSHYGQTRPNTRDGFVAWPPPGYIPYQIVFARWSFAYPDADFSKASVTMTSGGQTVSVKLSPIGNGYGENTLAWIPSDMSDDVAWPKPAADTTYSVKVSNVYVGGRAQNFTYDVVIFNP